MSDHAKPEEGHAGAGGHEDHGHPDSFYIKIWAILIVLLVLSMVGPFIGEYTGIIWITLSTAFGIAFVKAWLVIKNFMHLTVEKPIAWYILLSCLVMMMLFFAGVGADVMNHEGQNWVNYAAKNEVARGLAAGDGHGDHGATHDDHGAAHDDGGHAEPAHAEPAHAEPAHAEPAHAEPAAHGDTDASHGDTDASHGDTDAAHGDTDAAHGDDAHKDAGAGKVADPAAPAEDGH